VAGYVLAPAGCWIANQRKNCCEKKQPFTYLPIASGSQTSQHVLHELLDVAFFMLIPKICKQKIGPLLTKL
jgi:hypothetical protein